MYLVLATYDKKAETFSGPFISKKRATAMRDFSDECKNQKSILSQHAEDYSLWIIGEYDETHGTMIPKEKEKIGEAKNFVIDEEKK